MDDPYRSPQTDPSPTIHPRGTKMQRPQTTAELLRPLVRGIEATLIAAWWIALAAYLARQVGPYAQSSISFDGPVWWLAMMVGFAFWFNCRPPPWSPL